MYRVLILCTIFLMCEALVPDPLFRFDYKYFKKVDGWLKLHIAPMKWEEARQQCLYEGAVLASPLNEDLRNSVTEFLQEQSMYPDVVFSGVSSSFAHGIYRSVEGVSLERMSIQWSHNKSVISENCLVFYINGTMSSRRCDEAYPFVCYKVNENLIINECGTVDSEYQLDNETNRCYKIHSEPVSWATAFKICHSEGANLISVNEARTLQSPLQTVAIGYKFYSGSWWNTSGEPVKYLQPSGSFEIRCGGRNFDGRFVELYCDSLFPFICVKTVDSLLPEPETKKSFLQKFRELP